MSSKAPEPSGAFSYRLIRFGIIHCCNHRRYYRSMAYKGLADDFNKRRLIARGAVRTHFAEPWQWRVAVDKGAESLAPALFKKDSSHHSLFDYLAKDVGFGPDKLSTEPIEAGACILTYPQSSQPVVITMTVRDTTDRQLYKWFDTWYGKVVNSDGTFNLPFSYIKTVTIMTYADDSGLEKELWSGKVYPSELGDIQMSVDGEGFIEFPIVFQQFMTLGKYT